MYVADICVSCLLLWINSVISYAATTEQRSYTRPAKCATNSEVSLVIFEMYRQGNIIRIKM